MPYDEIKKRYEALIGEWLPEGVDGIGPARALVDFVAATILDRQMTEVFDFATVMGDERDQHDMLLALGELTH